MMHAQADLAIGAQAHFVFSSVIGEYLTASRLLSSFLKECQEHSPDAKNGMYTSKWDVFTGCNFPCL